MFTSALILNKKMRKKSRMRKTENETHFRRNKIRLRGFARRIIMLKIFLERQPKPKPNKKPLHRLVVQEKSEIPCKALIFVWNANALNIIYLHGHNTKPESIRYSVMQIKKSLYSESDIPLSVYSSMGRKIIFWNEIYSPCLIFQQGCKLKLLFFVFLNQLGSGSFNLDYRYIFLVAVAYRRRLMI